MLLNIRKQLNKLCLLLNQLPLRNIAYHLHTQHIQPLNIKDDLLQSVFRFLFVFNIIHFHSVLYLANDLWFIEVHIKV